MYSQTLKDASIVLASMSKDLKSLAKMSAESLFLEKLEDFVGTINQNMPGNWTITFKPNGIWRLASESEVLIEAGSTSLMMDILSGKEIVLAKPIAASAAADGDFESQRASA